MGMFNKATAKKLNEAPVADKKSKKKEIPIDGMRKLAVLEAIASMVKSAIEVTKNGFSETSWDKFISLAGTSGEKPESFNAIDGDAVVNVQIRKRSTNSPLSEEEISVLKEKGLQPREIVVTPELWAINPEYATNKEMMGKVEKALAKAGLPDDFFVSQDEVKKYVVSEAMEMEAWKNPDREVLDIVEVLAYRCTLNCEAAKLPDTLITGLKELLGMDEDEVKTAVKQVQKAESAQPAKKTSRKAA